MPASLLQRFLRRLQPLRRRCSAGSAAIPLALGLTLALAGLPARAEVTLALAPNPGSLPIYVAQARGLFAAEGVTVKTLDCSPGRLCLRQLLDGKAQLCTVADLPLVMAAFASERFSIVATINTNRNDTKIVTRRSSGIRSVTDLQGRRVATFLGTTAHYALESQLLFDGADPARVAVVDLQPGQERAALLERRVDAAAVFEPWAFEAARALGADALVLDSRRIYTQTWNLVAAPPPRGPAPAELQAVLRALDAAMQVIAREPGFAQQVLSERLHLGAELVRASWPTLGYELGLAQSLLTTMEGEARWAERRGLAQGRMPNFLDHVDSRPLRSLRPAAVSLAQ